MLEFVMVCQDFLPHQHMSVEFTPPKAWRDVG